MNAVPNEQSRHTTYVQGDPNQNGYNCKYA